MSGHSEFVSGAAEAQSPLVAAVCRFRDRCSARCSSTAATIQFADDVAAYCSADTTQAVASTLSTAVSSLASWLEERGLILNEKKSQVLTVFSGRDAGPRVTILCRSQALPTVTCAKYHGVITDEGLNFQQHLKAITVVARCQVAECLSTPCQFCAILSHSLTV